MTPVLPFLLDTAWDDLPARVQDQARACLLDLIATGVAGTTTPLSRIIRDFAVAQMGGPVPLPFDGREVSPSGAALAFATTIDAIDAHDGFNPVKGHIGCALMPSLLAVAADRGNVTGPEFLATLAVGYELAGRLGTALHASVSDYHTSGAWAAVAAAAGCSRLLGLNRDQTAHAMGIAEYHGPRSQMMRVIDHPTMLKDGSGWGALAGTSAAYLAQAGFTGAPAITAQAAGHWDDLGDRWLILEQYFKPYPVCRWAQAPVEGVLWLVREHALTSADVDHIEVASFHEAIRLATNDPRTTEEAQYSTSYPCAAALVRGTVGLAEVSPAALADPEIRRLSLGLKMVESDACNASFPAQRHAVVTLHLRDGRALTSPTMSPQWTAEAPPTAADLRAKFHSYADPLLGQARATAIALSVDALPDTPLAPLLGLLRAPLEPRARTQAAE